MSKECRFAEGLPLCFRAVPEGITGGTNVITFSPRTCLFDPVPLKPSESSKGSRPGHGYRVARCVVGKGEEWGQVKLLLAVSGRSSLRRFPHITKAPVVHIYYIQD